MRGDVGDLALLRDERENLEPPRLRKLHHCLPGEGVGAVQDDPITLLELCVVQQLERGCRRSSQHRRVPGWDVVGHNSQRVGWDHCVRPPNPNARGRKDPIPSFQAFDAGADSFDDSDTPNAPDGRPGGQRVPRRERLDRENRSVALLDSAGGDLRRRGAVRRNRGNVFRQARRSEEPQLHLTYSHLERRTLNVGKFPFHPAVEGRWANWYFPDGSWGLSGYPLNEAYSDPYDSSSWTGAGYLGIGSDDDTPEDAAAFWATYKFAEDGVWAGLTFGIGGQYESEREFVSARTDGSGQLQVDANGNPIALYTDPRINIDAMISYNFDFMERESRIQLNVNNLMDDRDQYGLGFAGGISARVEFGMVF